MLQAKLITLIIIYLFNYKQIVKNKQRTASQIDDSKTVKQLVIKKNGVNTWTWRVLHNEIAHRRVPAKIVMPFLIYQKLLNTLSDKRRKKINLKQKTCKSDFDLITSRWVPGGGRAIHSGSLYRSFSDEGSTASDITILGNSA